MISSTNHNHSAITLLANHNISAIMLLAGYY